MNRLVLLLAVVAVQGCTVVPSDGAGKAHYYFGFVRVAYPESRGKLTAIDVKSMGIGFDGAAFLGWRDSKFVYAEPGDCRTVIILRDRIEEDHVTQMLKALGDKACVADFAGSLLPP
jgi:hypothetical protein